MTGATPPTCATGTSIYTGTGTAHTHTGLSNGTQYSYRLCAYDNANNASAGATATATPSAVCSSANPTVTIVAPNKQITSAGGSVVYSEAAMMHLRQLGRLVLLDVPLDELQRRVRNMDSRGLVIDPGENFADLYQRRMPLYRQHAGLTIPCDGQSQEQLAAAIEGALCGM